MPPPPVPARAVLFDLGGVVLDIDFGRALAAWQRHSRLAPDALRERFGFDEPYERHETGALPAVGYFAHLRELLELDCDAAAVQAGFNAILVGEIADTAGLLERVRVPCYAISNTNAVHLAEMERIVPQLLRRFTRVFASHEIGHRKPHPESFRHVLHEIGLPPPEVLLFDDLRANVDGARAVGLQAVLVTTPADVRAALEERGLLGAASAP